MLHNAVAAAQEGRATVVFLRGDPGVGKTTLLREAGASSDVTVTRLRGIEAESDLEFAGLASLVEQLRDFLALLDPSPRLALEVATGRSAGQVSRLEVCSATLALLAAVAETRTLLLLVDDAQWLDASSAAALLFALGRLSADRVGAVIAMRRDCDWPADDLGATVVELGGLTEAASASLLARSGWIDPAVSRRCWELTGGNPLALLEMSRGLSAAQRMGTQHIESLPALGDRLERSLAARIHPLPAPTRLGLLIVAVSESESGLLGPQLRAFGLDLAVLDPAEEANVLVREPGCVEFSHPLLRHAVVASAPAAERREVHRRLAGLLTGDHERSRRLMHQVAAATGPDNDIGEALVQLASDDRARGAPQGAAHALEQAAAMSVEPAVIAERLLGAATALWFAGQPLAARRLLDRALVLVEGAPQRASIVALLGEVEAWTGDTLRGAQLLVSEARRIQESNPDAASSLLVQAATFTCLAGEVTRAAVVASEATVIAARATAPLQLGSQCVQAVIDLHRGGEGIELAEARLESLDLLAQVPLAGMADEVLFVWQLLAWSQVVRERWTLARSTVTGVIDAAHTRSHLGVVAFASALRAELDWRSGDWWRARLDCEPDLRLHRSEPQSEGFWGQATLARLQAAMGEADASRDGAERARWSARRLGMGLLEAWAHQALGLNELSRGNPSEAIDHLERVRDLLRTGGLRHGSFLWWQQDLLEAYAATGDHLAVRRLLDEMASDRAGSSRWVPAAIDSGRALVTSSDEAELAAGSAIEHLSAIGAPFPWARVLLLRATRRHRDGLPGARDDAYQALTLFRGLGAQPWAERAGLLLDKQKFESSTTTAAKLAALTTAELRVATCVGRGRTNKEAGAELYLSPKTIDAHLQSIYPKLGVRSRSELAALVASSRL